MFDLRGDQEKETSCDSAYINSEMVLFCFVFRTLQSQEGETGQNLTSLSRVGKLILA